MKNEKKWIGILIAAMLVISVFAAMPIIAEDKENYLPWMSAEDTEAMNTSQPMDLTTMAVGDDYFVYVIFNESNSEYRGNGNGVAGYIAPDRTEYLYVDASDPKLGGVCDIYTVKTAGDPNTHPENPDNMGPIEPRTLTLASTYDYTVSGGPTQYQSTNAFYVDNSGIYYGANGGIYRWDLDWTNGAWLTSLGVQIPPSLGTETLAYDAGSKTFYTGTSGREIYSFTVGVDTKWQYEFTHPDYAGSHHDGMEYFNGILWISDMTSDHIAEWKWDGSAWNEIKVFDYTNPLDVEGMGFGPNKHFWITAWNDLYEVGGGKLQEEIESTCIPCVSINVDVSINNNNGKIPYWPWNVFRYNVSVTNNQTYKPGKSRIAITYGLIDDPTSHTLIIGTRMPDIYLSDTYNISGDFMVPNDVYSGNYVFFASAFDLETGCCGCNAVPFSVEMPSGWISTTSKEESWENWLEIVED